MTLKKRLLTILVIALCVGGIYGLGRLGVTVEPVEEEAEENVVFGHRDTLYLWYTDEALTDYLNSVAVAYSEYQDDVRVMPVYTSGREYLETISQASLQGDETPDLYIVGNDSLEKAYLAGLASRVALPEQVAPLQDVFPETAVRAVTYQDKLIGYPFYFETSCFLYNETYLKDWARAQIEAERDAQEGEEAQRQIDADDGADSADNADGGNAGGGNAGGADAADTGAGDGSADGAAADEAGDGAVTDEAVLQRVEEILPETIDDILIFADTYDAPEQVEAVFKWDVSDIFYNYFFVGNAIDVGGVNGDMTDSIHIYTEDAIRCLKVYQNLNQFFSIDTKEISYDGVLQDFMDGKIVYTVATTDALSRIEQAKAEGGFDFDYGISKMPNVSGELRSASLSVTQCVVVNGYSTQKEMANEFAVFLTEYATDSLYARTGKLPICDSGDTYDDPNKAAFLEEYDDSVPMPKMIETSNFWVELEIAFAKIWDGEDANADLKALSEQIMAQVTGEAYEEEYIDVPDESASDAEETVDGDAGGDGSGAESGDASGE